MESDSRGAVLLALPKRAVWLEQALRQEGYAPVYAPEAGQAERHSWKGSLLSLRRQYRSLCDRHVRVALAGEGCGALMSLILAAEYPADALALLAPPVYPRLRALLPGGCPSPLPPAALIALSRRNLFAVTCPVLLVQSKEDPIAQRGSAHRLLSSLQNGADRRTLWLNHSGAYPTQGGEKALLLSALLAFLAQTAGETRMQI